MIIKNANIHTITKGILEGFDLRIEDGKIANIRKVLRVFPKEEVFEADGMWVYPGFIDAHSHIGLHEEAIQFEGNDVNERTDSVTPQVRAIDGINPLDSSFTLALSGGITTALVTPGSANVLGGQGCIIKIRGNRVDDMLVDEYSVMKCAFGENPKRSHGTKGKMPITRMGTTALLREALFKARDYMNKKKQAGDDVSKLPAYDFKSESLIPLLEKKVTLKAHAHRTDDIFSAIRVAKEFDLNLTLDHCTEGHLISEALEKEGYPAIVGPSFGSKVKYELKEKSFDTVKELLKAGVKVAITTDSPVLPLESLSLCASLAVKSGISEQEALECITINPAEIIGLGERLGSIEVGKDADLVFWDSNPLDISSEVQYVFIDGEIVYDKKQIKK